MSKLLRNYFTVAGLCLLAGATLLRIPVSAVPGATSAPRNDQEGVVILELFTSEGCSSCPAADDILSDLARRYPHKVAALSEHVDYWNNLGWTDPNSAPVFTNRQRAYSNKLGLNQVYTPQLIVDGVAQTVGNSQRKVDNLLSDALKHPPGKLVLSPTLNKSKGEIEVSCLIDPRWFKDDTLQVAVTEDGLVSKVTSGENSGRTLKHDGAVRAFAASKISTRNASPDGTRVYSFKTQPGWNLSRMTIVAFVQEDGSGKIVASGKSMMR